MTGSTVEQIREGFHYPIVDRQPGLPSYNTINYIHTFFKNNASVPSLRGKHGILDLILNNALNLNLTITDFIKLLKP